MHTRTHARPGYCQVSCGRCPCCSDLAATLRSKGLNAFAWLLNLTGEGGGGPGELDRTE